MTVPARSHHPILEIANLSKEYRTGDEPFLALAAIDLRIESAEFLGITGKSGAGKTTLLNMIAGVSHPTSGEIHYYGAPGGNGRTNGHRVPIHLLGEDELARWRGEHLGIVYQSFELMPTLNLVENVILPPDFSGDYRPGVSRERALELLDLVGISEHAYKLPAQISGGQKQRVAIARALVNDPPLIVADEPTGNLDSVTAETIFRIFERLVERGKTVVMVTHDEALAPRFSRRLEISDGRLGAPSGNGSGPSRADASMGRAAEYVRGSGLSSRAAGASGNGHGMVPGARHAGEAAIRLEGVTKIFEGTAGTFTALKSVDLEFGYGEFISVVGKSGSGKSTLLNMITGIDHPTSGEVTVGGQRIYALNESQRARWRGRNMGIVFQFFQLLPTLSLLENTMLPMDYGDVHPFAERPARAMDLLRMVGLEAHAHKLPASVSSGQQQSAAIARALAADPSILLADEPTGNLDSRSAEAILRLFERLAEQGKTVIIVTHDPSVTRRTDRTVILSDGEIVDSSVARALPFLSHPQMLAATRQARPATFLPGSGILRQGDPVESLYLIARGEVEIIGEGPTGGEVRLATMGPGQFFGEIELRQGVPSIAGVRAGRGEGVELVVLPKAAFADLVDESALAEEVLGEVAASRWADHHRTREAAG